MERLRAARASGKTGFDSYQVEEAEDVYEDVDEEAYKKVVRKRLDQDDFVVDDNGARIAPVLRERRWLRGGVGKRRGRDERQCHETEHGQTQGRGAVHRTSVSAGCSVLPADVGAGAGILSPGGAAVNHSRVTFSPWPVPPPSPFPVRIPHSALAFVSPLRRICYSSGNSAARRSRSR